MDCPVCKDPMVALELNEVEIDYSISCGGIWLDEGELELLLEDSGEKDLFLASFKPFPGCKEKKHKCPICKKKMTKVICGEENQVTIDKCPHNHGIWFDAGELEEVLKLGNLGRDNRVLSLLKDMFGKK